MYLLTQEKQTDLFYRDLSGIPLSDAATYKVFSVVTEAANANVPIRVRQTIVPIRRTRARLPDGVVTVRAISLFSLFH